MSGKIKLVTFPSKRECFNFSPFCMKVEVYLKLTQTPYELVSTTATFRAPKKKLPYIIDGREKVADSGLIIDYLRMKFNHKIDDWLSQEQHAMGHTIRRMMEEHFYFCLVYSRWLDDGSWPGLKKILFDQIPAPLSLILPSLLRRRTRSVLNKQGIGRHSEEEIYAAAKQDLLALKILLGEKAYVLGDQVSSYDAAVFSFLSPLIESSFDGELEKEAQATAEFKDYVMRMREKLATTSTETGAADH